MRIKKIVCIFLVLLVLDSCILANKIPRVRSQSAPSRNTQNSFKTDNNYNSVTSKDGKANKQIGKVKSSQIADSTVTIVTSTCKLVDVIKSGSGNWKDYAKPSINVIKFL